MQVFLRQLPLLLALLSLGMGLAYLGSLQISLQDSLALWRDRAGLELSTADLLKSTEYADISYAMPLAFLYIGTFVTAEGALLIMALAEYLGELAHKE